LGPDCRPRVSRRPALEHARRQEPGGDDLPRSLRKSQPQGGETADLHLRINRRADGIAEISRAVHAAADHLTLLDPVVHSHLIAAAGSAARPAPAPARLPDNLTRREAEVLSLIARGLSNGEIAATLVVSEATVKTHINHVFAKIGARDRAQTVHYAYSHGLAGTD
jgi:DNA-binding CsgD family transcriptional regulator